MSSTDVVRVTTRIAVDPATAFDLFTREVDAWWKHGPRFRPGAGRSGRMVFETGVGGRLLEVYDGSVDAFELGRVLAWEPAERLVFEMGGRDFAPGEATEVEVRFAREGEGTRVTVEHRGWDRLAADHPALHGLRGPAFTNLMAVWWADQLVALGLWTAAVSQSTKKRSGSDEIP